MDQDFHAQTLADGVTLHVAPTEKFKTITFQLVLRRPLRAAEHSQTAVIPFVLRRGTERFPSSRAIARYMEELYGAQFSADIGKVGETQNIELSLQVAHSKFLPEANGLLEEAVGFLAEGLAAPVLEDGVFKSDYVKQEAETLRRRIERMINNSPQYALNRLREEMCRDEPFGLHRYGDKDALAQVEPGPLYDHYKSVLETSPVDVFVVGAVTPEHMGELLQGRLPLPRHGVQEVPALAIGGGADGASGTGGFGGSPSAHAKGNAGGSPANGEGRVVVEEQPVQQGVLTLGYRTGVTYRDENYPALLVYNGILGGYPHSKLFVNVREKASLAYFASSQLEATKGVLFIAAGIAPEKYAQALAIVRDQVTAMAAGDISDDELAQTKKSLINSLRSGRDSPDRIIGSRYLGLVNGRLRHFNDTIDQIGAVTKDDVQQLAGGLREDTVYFLRSPKST